MKFTLKNGYLFPLRQILPVSSTTTEQAHSDNNQTHSLAVQEAIRNIQSNRVR